MKSITLFALKKFFAILLIALILSENTIITLQIHSTINANANVNEDSKSTSNRRKSKVKTLTKSKSRTENSSKSLKSTEPGDWKTVALAGSFAVAAGLFFSKCAPKFSSQDTAEDKKKKIEEVKSKTLAVSEITEQHKKRTNFLIELLEEKPEIENEFKDKIMRKIATFISFFDQSFYVKDSNERNLLISYVDCYLTEARKTPENLIDFESPEDSKIDEVTKFNYKYSAIIHAKKDQKVQKISLSASIDDFLKEFIKDELPKFKECKSKKITEFLSNKSYTAAIEKFTNIIEQLEKPKLSKEASKTKFGQMKKKEKSLYDKAYEQLKASLDLTITYSKKAELYSENILTVSENIKKVIDFCKDPKKIARKEIKEKFGIKLEKKELDKIIKKIEPLKQVVKDIEKFGKYNKENFKKVKAFLKEHEGKIEKIMGKAGKIKKYAELADEILKGYESLNAQDRPSIYMAKVAILAANTSRIIPYNSPMKTFMEDSLEEAGKLIKESESLQDHLDEGITNQAKEIIKCTNKGIVPRCAFSNFHDDLDPNLMDYKKEDLPYYKVIKEAIGDKVKQIDENYQEGTIVALDDFAGGDFGALSRWRKEKNEKEQDSFIRSRPCGNSESESESHSTRTRRSRPIRRKSTVVSKREDSSSKSSHSEPKESSSDSSHSEPIHKILRQNTPSFLD